MAQVIKRMAQFVRLLFFQGGIPYSVKSVKTDCVSVGVSASVQCAVKGTWVELVPLHCSIGTSAQSDVAVHDLVPSHFGGPTQV